MLQITRFICNMIEENTYLLYDETGEAVLVDCGAYFPEERKAIQDFLVQHNLQLTHLLNTHAHFDHIFGADFVYKEYGVQIELCADEQSVYEAANEQMRMFIHRELPLELPPVGRYFKDGDVLTFGNQQLQVIATPGHTPGGVCFYHEAGAILLSGDSLFQGAIGRCDLPGGNEVQLVESLQTRILTLPESVQVLPGHGDASTIGEERRSNPYL